jgi:hypothetical protein
VVCLFNRFLFKGLSYLFSYIAVLLPFALIPIFWIDLNAINRTHTVDMKEGMYVICIDVFNLYILGRTREKQNYISNDFGWQKVLEYDLCMTESFRKPFKKEISFPPFLNSFFLDS